MAKAAKKTPTKEPKATVAKPRAAKPKPNKAAKNDEKNAKTDAPGQPEDGKPDFGIGAGGPTPDRAANESMQRAGGEKPPFQPAIDAQRAIEDLGKAVDDMANTDRKSHDLVHIRDVRDEAKAVMQRLEQFVSAP